MEKARRNTRFHEALKKIYFPPLPSPHHEQKQVETEGLDLFDSSKLGDDDGLIKDCNESSPSEAEGSDSNKKLTRSQRKRIRKRKLREAASASPAKRRKMIGPLLPKSDVLSSSCEHLQLPLIPTSDASSSSCEHLQLPLIPTSDVSYSSCEHRQPELNTPQSREGD